MTHLSNSEAREIHSFQQLPLGGFRALDTCKRSRAMNRFKKILFPVDFSAACEKTAPYVAAFARTFRADITLLHVNIPLVDPLGCAWEPQTDHLTSKLNDFADKYFSGFETERLVRVGDPGTEIIRFVNNERAILIMIPTHGFGPFRRFLLGSVTNKVLHDAVCPVWTSAHSNNERPPAPPNLANVVCAIDLDEAGMHTLRYASGVAADLGARLIIAHAVPTAETPPDSYLDAEFRADLITAARKRIAEMQSLVGSNGIVCVGAGSIARLVSHAAMSHQAGMVIIGRGSEGLLSGLRTHDYSIIRHCECPVLSV
jgi:nucleotide-binding universal stress UspA family protein